MDYESLIYGELDCMQGAIFGEDFGQGGRNSRVSAILSHGM